MIVHRAVIVHGLTHANAALAIGLPVTLLSAPGAALFAGCLWWRALVAAARAAHADTEATDILDCADASGMAIGALRSGICNLVLWPDAPGWNGIAAIAERQGGCVISRAPAALDLAQPNSIPRLHAWLRGADTTAGDNDPCLR